MTTKTEKRLERYRQYQARQAQPWRDMKTAPKDGTAVLVLTPGSDIPKSARWRNDCWEMNWDGHRLSEYDLPRYWMACPSDPDALAAPQPTEPVKVPGDDIQRDTSGETWMGMRVAAWQWKEQTPLGEVTQHATHWSTGPKDAERLYRESDIRALLARHGSIPSKSTELEQPAASAEPMGFKNFHRMLCERFGYPHDESDWHRDQVSLMEHIAAKHAINEMPIELRGVAETLAEGGGSWRTCCGCHELNEGHSTGPYSNALQCHLGCGCSECGGIGAVWDDTDYDEMADHMARDMSAPVAVQPGVILPMGLRAVATELLACFRAWEPGVRVLGNVQAKDGADLMQAILAPTTPADGLAQQDALPVTPQEDEAWDDLARQQ